MTPPAIRPVIELMSNLADIIAQETQDGRLIVHFLLSAMDGDFPDFLPCHRIDAARLLVKLGFDQARAQRAAAQRAPNRDSRSQPDSGPNPKTPTPSAPDWLKSSARKPDGRFTVQFLIEAMQGEFPDFKPCHRISAAKELQRGFDYLPEDQDVPEAADAAAPEPEPELTPEDFAAQRRAERIEFSKHGPRYYRNYAFPASVKTASTTAQATP